MLAVSAGKTVCPASCWIKTSEEGVPKPGFFGTWHFAILECYFSCPANVWRMVISLEWGHGHQRLNGMHFMALTSISWLCVSLSQRSEKGRGGNKRADECLLLFLSWLDWHPAAFLLPDHLGYCDESSPFFFCICCLASAFESLKHNKHKKSREAGKVVLIFFSFFFLGAVTFVKECVKFNIGWGQFCMSHTYTPAFLNFIFLVEK